jgi:long-chain acyl-CoA synthetase
MSYQNLSSLHRAGAERWALRTALSDKRGGTRRALSWADYRRQADWAASGLIGLGVGAGDRVGLLSENRAKWLVADVAVLAAGAADVAMHAPLAPGQAQYQLAHSEARAAIVSNQEQADKVLAGLGSLPRLEVLISFDPVDAGGRVRHLSWDELVRQGRESGESGRARVLEREAGLTRGSVATLIYTSGTTGNPKGVVLTHGNLLSNAEAVAAMAEIGPDDVALSWLPYSHIYARTVDHYLTMLTGGTLCLAESMETLPADLAEVHPTLMNAVPRFYEKVWSLVESLAPEDRRKRLSAIFGPRVRWLSSGGAPLPRHVADGFHGSGLLLLEGYGLTESSPVITFNRVASYRLGTVGQPIPGVEVKIAADGEILTRGPHVMAGYWKDPEATSRTIVDGWLYTGDVGRLDADGFLTITDRKKDLIITSGGKNIAPSELEGLLLSDPYVDQAVVYGDRKPFVTALIVPNLDALRAKARELGCALEQDGEFLWSLPLHDFIASRVERVMEAVSKPERVKAFLLLARPFSMESGELTPTRKVRRRQILDTYRDRLDALYTEKPSAGSWDVDACGFDSDVSAAREGEARHTEQPRDEG